MVKPPRYTEAATEEHPVIHWPVYTAPKKKGDISTTPSHRHRENSAALLDAYGILCRWNLMKHSLELTIPGFSPEAERAENATLAKAIELAQRNGLQEATFVSHLLTLAQAYHPVLDWIRSRPWDGEDRLPALCATVQLRDNCDPDFAGVLMMRWLTSCAVAVLPPVPGRARFTPQGVLVFQGPQGIGKTEWLKALAPPDKDWIATGRVLDPHNRDSVQQLTSNWICELGELDATYRKSDISALKAFVTQDIDIYRSAYARREERVPRRTVLAASVNPQYFLVDDTGNRRWWTLPVARLDWQHGIDTQQVWAQVVHNVETAAAPWWLTPDESLQLAALNGNHEIGDPIVHDLWQTWRVVPVSSTTAPARVSLAEIWTSLPGREYRARTRAESSALANALRLAHAENENLLHGSRTYRVERLLPAAASSSERRWQP